MSEISNQPGEGEGDDDGAAALFHDVRHLDSRALQGLAHPLRVRIYEELTYRGPATATKLAERLGESSGSTSYHLRQLARSGFVEEDADRGTNRERWWRRVPGGIHWGDPQQLPDSASRVASELLISEFDALAVKRRTAALADIDRWPAAWHDTQVSSRVHLVLTAEEGRRLALELQGIVDAWKRRLGDRDLIPASERDDALADVDVELTVVPLIAPEQLVERGAECADDADDGDDGAGQK